MREPHFQECSATPCGTAKLADQNGTEWEDGRVFMVLPHSECSLESPESLENGPF